jgi:hypothetical protein
MKVIVVSNRFDQNVLQVYVANNDVNPSPDLYEMCTNAGYKLRVYSCAHYLRDHEALVEEIAALCEEEVD